MKNLIWKKSISITLCLLSTILFLGLCSACSSDSEPIYGDICYEGDCQTPLYEVQYAVACVMADPATPIWDLSNDPRIDWENCAKSEREATNNMTGYVVNGNKPLIALNSSSGSANPISHYLYKQAKVTKHRYWIKESNGVICTIMDDGKVWCPNGDIGQSQKLENPIKSGNSDTLPEEVLSPPPTSPQKTTEIENNEVVDSTEQVSSNPTKDIKFKYRESFEMKIGESKTVLFFLETDNLAPQGVQPVGRKPHYTFGVLSNGELAPLPNGIEIVRKSTRTGMPFPTYPKTTVEFQTSFDILSGSYGIAVQIELEGLGVVGQVPFNINVVESGDDICNTSEGLEYRANIPELNNGQWPTIDETTITLIEANEKNEAVLVKYRDSIKTRIGEPIGIIFTLNTAGTELENQQIEYSVHEMRDDSTHPLSYLLELTKSYTYQASDGDEFITVLVLRALEDATDSSPYSLVVQLSSIDTIVGQLPLTVEVLESNDDIYSGPGGAYYRANVNRPGLEKLPPIDLTTITLVDVD